MNDSTFQKSGFESSETGSAPVWLHEQLLSTNGEIRELKIGFPSREQETTLRRFFVACYEKQVLEIVNTFLLENNLSHTLKPKELRRITAVCYGIYFYNYISRGIRSASRTQSFRINCVIFIYPQKKRFVLASTYLHIQSPGHYCQR